MQAGDPKSNLVLQNIVYVILCAILVGYLLIIGKALLLPIFISLISVYILISASDWLGAQPVTRALPVWARRGLVLLSFVCAIVALSGVMVNTAEQLVDEIPSYQENLKLLITHVLEVLGLNVPQDWSAVWENTVGDINLQGLATGALGSLSSLGGIVFMVIIYAMFLMAERGGFAQKIAVALPGNSGAQVQNIVGKINRSIGDYLAVKTLINIILAAISFVILWLFDVDFALFWAILIGLLNYIPFVGSLVGVAFPTVLSIAQFGSLQTTAFILILLTTAQMWVGNGLEPRMIGKKVNMSPFVVLVSLSLWTSLWGIAGSILAIPLTSMLMIIFWYFEDTRPFAVLLSADPEQMAKEEE